MSIPSRLPETATRFCLIRHGETAWNAQRRYQGQIDIGLNAVGEAQARALQDFMRQQKFARVVSSDLARAARTAQLAAEGSVHAVSQELTFRERHYGVFQGLTVDEARTVHPEAHYHYQTRSLDYDFETGESLTAFSQRIQGGFAALAAQHPQQTLAVFTHGGVLDVVYRWASGRDLRGPRDFPIPNAGVNWLTLCGDVWTIESWGERAHLSHLDKVLDEVAQ